MTRGTPRLSLTGSPLIRLLARLAEVDAPDSKQAFAERLSQWLGWTDAISLSAALKGSASGTRSAARPAGATTDGERASLDDSPQARDCRRARAGLEKALADEQAPDTGRPRSGRPAPRHDPSTDMPTDFASYRRRYFTRQQAMDAAIGPLRAQLRTALTHRSPELARLAAVDAVMEQALGERERTLLSMVPVLLEKRFEHLRLAAPPDTVDNTPTDPDSPAQPAAASSTGVWLETFRQDMHSVLHAELDLRWQPIDGLLEALRARP